MRGVKPNLRKNINNKKLFIEKLKLGVVLSIEQSRKKLN